MSTINERLKDISRHYGLTSYAKFAERAGLSHQTASNYLKGKQKPDIEKLSIIKQSFDEIDANWLLTGEGKMLNQEQKSTSLMVNNNLPSINKEYQGVPYYDVDFIGGFDLVFGDNTITPTFYIDFSPFNDADYWVNVSGKSMSPFISNGDIVALKKFDSWNDFILFGEIYAIVTDDFRTIKIVGKGKDKEHFSLIPYCKSPEFSQQDIPKRLIKNMFKVKGSIKKFF